MYGVAKCVINAVSLRVQMNAQNRGFKKKMTVKSFSFPPGLEY